MSKMKIIPLIVLVVIIVGTITLSLPIISNQISPDKSINKTERATLLSYTPHSPITIATDADFSSQGWPGNGTKGNPYLIEGLNITSSSTCISISDTRVYFEIRNCLISSISASVNTGIYLYNVTSGVLDSCRIDSHNVGVDLYWSHNCRLNNNTVINNQDNGFLLRFSENCTLLDNEAINNLNNGICLRSAFNTTLISNLAFNNVNDGFNQEGTSMNCTLKENEAIENTNNGFYFWYSYFTILKNNSAKGNQEDGFILYNALLSELNDNTATANHDGFVLIDSDGSILTNNTSTNNTSSGFFFSAADLTLNNNTARENKQEGFRSNLSNNCKLVNNTAVDNTYAGFILTNSILNELIQNTALDHLQYGFRIAQSNNFNITQNRALENGVHGFYFDDVTYSFADNNIALGGSWAGYYLISSSFCNFSNNRASNSANGYYIDGLNDCKLESNSITDHTGDGLFLKNSSNCTIVNNTITGSIRYGAYLYTDSEDNLLYLNRFGGNGDSNAYDEGIANSWDNGTHGNYWSDYGGAGVYNVPGTALSVDHYPFTFQYSPPELDQPSDIEYLVGSMGNVISWTANASHPASYQILRNDTIIRSGLWNASSEVISISVDGLAIGAYLYRVEVLDTFDVSAADEVLVTVLQSITSPPISTTTVEPTTPTYVPNGNPFGETMLIVFGGMIVILVIVAMEFRRKSR